MSFLEKIEVNPKISLEKGKVYPFVEMANVGFYTREPALIDEKPFSSGVRFEDGDTVVARITPCLQNGKGFYCHGIGKGFGSTEYLVFRPKDDRVDNQYLYYLMQTDYVRESMIKSMVGATGRQRVNNDVFTRIDVDFPEITVQKKVANVLSAYDNLIENNQKQIKLLEEAAQRLYKEWFVDLRFPGYEDTEIVDGVPEGWHKGLLKELVEINYGKDHKKAPDNGNVPVYGSGGLMRKCNKSLFKGEAVLIPRKGSLNHIMYVNEEFWTVDTMFFATAKQTHTTLFVYFYIKQYDMYAMNIGAAVPSMTTKILDAMDILIPSDDTLEVYDKHVQTYLGKVRALSKENEGLIQARDRLLPKLMNGELEV